MQVNLIVSRRITFTLMTPEEFVQCFRREKQQLLETYFDTSSKSAVGQRISEVASI